MLDILEFILSKPSNYFGTLGLILMIGIALHLMLAPFSEIGSPKIIRVPSENNK